MFTQSTTRSVHHAAHDACNFGPQVAWPADKSSSSSEPRYYSEQDLAVGAVLAIHGRHFELLNADEFTYQVRCLLHLQASSMPAHV